eukprot:TRINITY_DN42569_c0_g1_i1.p1 TRINITY_DN42569_c0_g1~~TRINITY_DN42569_c0_g1_i1.p1  ORF type:complete len:795 (-),score=205.46 TRINITY_DN42569_c0_g1_i1:106-2490(-)
MAEGVADAGWETFQEEAHDASAFAEDESQDWGQVAQESDAVAEAEKQRPLEFSSGNACPPQVFDPASPSALLARRLEEAPEACVEELLDEGDQILQALRFGNFGLLERLCCPEALNVLVQHVTQEPHRDVPAERAQRRSHTAAEILASCGSSGQMQEDGKETAMSRIADLFFAEVAGGFSPLHLLWSFVVDAQADDAKKMTWPVLAGYFCSTAAAIHSRRPEEVVGHLRARGAELVLERFLQLLGSRCMAELFTTLLCPAVPEQILFPVEGLMHRLVQCFAVEAASGTGSCEHVALAISSLLAQACSGKLCYALPVLEQVSSPEVVDALVQQAVVLRPAHVAAAAVNTLCIAMTRLHRLPSHPLLPCMGADLLQVSSTWVEDEQETCGSSDEHSEGDAVLVAGHELVQEICTHMSQLCDSIFGPQEVEARSEVQPGHCEWQPRGQELREAIIVVLEAQRNGMCDEDLWNRLLQLSQRSKSIEEVLGGHVTGEGAATPNPLLKEQLLADLRRARAEAEANAFRSSAAFTYDGQECASSLIVTEALSMLVLLARTRNATAYKEFIDGRLLQRCLRLLFQRRWGTVVLNAVWAFVSEVSRCPLDLAQEAIVAFLREGETMGLIIEALRMARDTREGAEARMLLAREGGQVGDRGEPAVNFNGQLRGICADLRELGSRCQEVQECLQCLSGWSEVVLPELSAVALIEQEPLGGSPVLPEQDLSIVAAAIGDETVEFTPEDLRDLDEDFDTENLLSLASEQQLQRQAQVQAISQSGSSAGPLPPLTGGQDEGSSPDEWV